MALEQLKIHEIVRQAVGKSVDVPEFQRDFVWDPEQVKLLVESLYRDYPVGSFLLWDSSEYQESKTARGTQASLWIVDGQQRTTALCLLLGQKPYWWASAEKWNSALERNDVMVNVSPEEGDGRVEFALPNPVRRRDPRWVSVRRILGSERVEDLTPLAQEVVKGVTADPSRQIELFGRVHGHMQRLWQIRERDIPVVKITHEVEDVAEIFSRLNRQGTRVKEADVTLALAAARNPGWVRNVYLPFRNELEERGWDLDAGIFIRTMTGVGHGRARLIEVPKDFWSPTNLPSVWKQTARTIREVLKRLAQFGVLSAELLPSTNSLIPLFVLHSRWSIKPDYSFSKALHWFLLANRDGRYSGSAITSLNEDVRAIKDADDFDGAIDSLFKRLRVPSQINQEEFLNRYDRAGNRFLRLILYLVMFNRNARDWVDNTRIGYDKTGSPITTGFEPQWHHIYPRSILRKASVEDDKIHALANITVLNERTNVIRLADKEPWRYIQQFKVSSETLQAHLVPEVFSKTHSEDQWGLQKYGEFLAERAQLLAEEANRFMDNLRAGGQGQSVTQAAETVEKDKSISKHQGKEVIARLNAWLASS
jgi:hypothetical protein